MSSTGRPKRTEAATGSKRTTPASTKRTPAPTRRTSAPRVDTNESRRPKPVVVLVAVVFIVGLLATFLMPLITR